MYVLWSTYTCRDRYFRELDPVKIELARLLGTKYHPDLFNNLPSKLESGPVEFGERGPYCSEYLVEKLVFEDDRPQVSKCGFCKTPCGNSWCPSRGAK